MILKKNKAFIFSIDSLLAIALVILVTYVFVLQPLARNPAVQLNILNKTILHDYALIGFYTDSNSSDLIDKDSRIVRIGSTDYTVKDALNLNLWSSELIADDNKFVYCASYYNYDLNSNGFWLNDGNKGNAEKKDLCAGVS